MIDEVKWIRVSSLQIGRMILAIQVPFPSLHYPELRKGIFRNAGPRLPPRPIQALSPGQFLFCFVVFV